MALKARLSNTGAQILAPGGRSVSYKGVGTGWWYSLSLFSTSQDRDSAGQARHHYRRGKLFRGRAGTSKGRTGKVSLDHGREGSSAWTETALPEIRNDVNDQCTTGTASGSRLGLYTSSKAAWSRHSGLGESESDSGHRSSQRCSSTVALFLTTQSETLIFLVVAPMYNPSLFNSTADNSPPHARIHWKKLAR
ncbi:unnamed protein product [Leuciscus chuanchicus]